MKKVKKIKEGEDLRTAIKKLNEQILELIGKCNFSAYDEKGIKTTNGVRDLLVSARHYLGDAEIAQEHYVGKLLYDFYRREKKFDSIEEE